MTIKSLLAFVIFPVVGLFLLNSCTDEDTYPVTPEINFKSLEIFQNSSQQDSVILTFSFTDGDGDIGSITTDSLSRDVFIKFYELRNGVFIPFDDPFGAFNYRIPYLEPRGNNKSLKGDIRINVDYNVLQPNDTVKYELYLKDRAGHQSNTVVTSTIVTRVQ
ncbi:MAG: hypothetical protein M3Q95_12930 [Bacteroidota bacterium]|nr:hypothetical protein [Bacteroidota bacterium]